MGIIKEVCLISDLKNRRGKKIVVEELDLEIAIFKTEKGIFSLSNICPHQHAHVISDGFVDEDNCVTCPLHNWTFNLEDGKVVGGVAAIKTYKTLIEGEKVLLELPDNETPLWMDF
ncbi:MAG: nitrite reductase small subunit NirD [Chlorobi bacterium]|nr:nitrite reductase small subunit NirD [Chlorobiota bacterium]